MRLRQPQLLGQANLGTQRFQALDVSLSCSPRLRGRGQAGQLCSYSHSGARLRARHSQHLVTWALVSNRLGEAKPLDPHGLWVFLGQVDFVGA